MVAGWQQTCRGGGVWAAPVTLSNLLSLELQSPLVERGTYALGGCPVLVPLPLLVTSGMHLTTPSWHSEHMPLLPMVAAVMALL